MKTGLFRLTVLTLALISLLGRGQPVSAQAGTTYFITEVDSSQFPTVTFQLRAVDLNNRVVSGLNNADLTIYENGNAVPAENVQVTPHDDGPITFLFLIDHGRLANFNEFGPQNVRQVFSALASSGAFVNGLDQLEVMVRENINNDRTEARLGPTQQIGDLTTWLANYPFEVRRSQNSTKGLEGVADAIAEMGKLVPVPGSQTAVILFLTRYIEDPARSVAVVAAQNQASQAKSEFISIYPLSTDLGQSNREPLEILAEISNGRYAALQRNTASALAEDIYREINTQRTYYTVSYESTIADTATRVITVNTSDVSPAGTVGTYQVSPEPPTARIQEPAEGTVVQREAVRDSNGEPVYSPASLKVVVEAFFPDGFTRSLQSAELFVDGASYDTVSPPAGSTQAQLDFDLTEFSTAGKNPVALEVRIVDSLGLEASAETSVVVEVARAPASGLGSPVALGAGAVVLICMGGLALVAVVGGFFFLRSRSQKAPAPAARPAQAEPPHTLLAGRAMRDQVLATLTVLEGPKGLIGEAVNILKPTTVMGRNPQTTDIHFYADEESSVSRIHCTIQKDGEVFKLTDNGSSAGTRLNGRAIPANDPVVLADNDEIVLGDLGRRGVKMRFNAVAEPGEAMYSGSADDRTRIIDEPPPDEDHFAGYVD
ncbi:MAG TPA: FHA domain-containing protein [Anaerolineales bacterium]|nr:FHA domain-containing protein [Anaerolineales bacterium]